MLVPRFRTLIILAAVFVFGALRMSAQEATGTIRGTVHNAGGEAMPGATVTVINRQTNLRRTTVSGPGGAFEVTGLPPGPYAVVAELPGFRSATQSRLLGAGEKVDFDMVLEVRASEEVTVTAMKREETVFSTPVSIAAPTEETLRERGAEDLEDVAANVAGFAVQNLGPGQSQVSMRGVSSGQIARDQPGPKEEVGSYLDESVISFLLFSPDIDLFDMNRVEVLRGPQGTLYGSGSLSGTVRYISNQPQLGQTQFFGELSGDTLTDGNQGGSVKAGVNAPLGDRAALRVVGYYDRLAGWMDAVQPDLSIKKNVNTGDRFGFRAAVQIAPDDRLSITPRFVYQKLEADGWNRIDIYNILANPFTTTRPRVTLGDRKLFTQVGEPYTDKFYLADLNVRYDFGAVALTSITSYTHRDILVVRDAGALTSSITGGSLGLPERVYSLDAPLNDVTKAHGWTEELRLSGGPDRFKWVAGGFYSDSTKKYGQDLTVTGFTALSGIPSRGLRAPTDHLFFSDLSYKTRQYALFGEGTFAATERFSLT
ncbi:MAG TPA: TonB-dependent receptor, partial [Thermoanaerobaculia bacterium]